MTDLDPHDVQLARRATGVLRDFNELAVLGVADVHVATRLGRLGGEDDQRVLLAAALTVRALRAGSVCLDVATAQATTAVEDVGTAELDRLDWPEPLPWLAALAASPLVAVGSDGDPDRPLRLVGSTLYLDRYWRQEERIADVLDAAALRPPPVVDTDRLAAALVRIFPGDDPDRQRLAAVVAAHRWVSVLAGGPGTGKTTTVAKLLALLQDQAHGSLRIALAAPTAVAAARLTFAARAVAAGFTIGDQDRLAMPEASTLHRLLGYRPGSRTRFRHDRNNRLPFDVVVVDEASMVSLTMMARLVDALRPGCRMVLVGDPDQLASVEAGAVLGDLVQRDVPVPDELPFTGLVGRDVADLDVQERAGLDRGVVRLSRVHRFSVEIQSFAEAVRSGDPDRVTEVLERHHPQIEFVEVDPRSDADLGSVRADVVQAGVAVHDAAMAGDGALALQALGLHRLLCAHREGPFGVTHWSDLAEGWLRTAISGYTAGGRWYVGRPLLVTSNDYQLRLFNGDTGVVVEAGDRPRAAFLRSGVVDLFAPSRLSDVQTVHAMTVHRSQGSQFDRVTLVLPPAESPLLTRELLYTGLTRAKDHVRIIGSRDALATACRRPIVRASGLRNRR
ncbi:MAG: exodeoxyribonuclease V subunit alpha [Nocardioidaceae bacterium]